MLTDIYLQSPFIYIVLGEVNHLNSVMKQNANLHHYMSTLSFKKTTQDPLIIFYLIGN